MSTTGRTTLAAVRDDARRRRKSNVARLFLLAHADYDNQGYVGILLGSDPNGEALRNWNGGAVEGADLLEVTLYEREGVTESIVRDEVAALGWMPNPDSPTAMVFDLVELAPALDLAVRAWRLRGTYTRQTFTPSAATAHILARNGSILTARSGENLAWR